MLKEALNVSRAKFVRKQKVYFNTGLIFFCPANFLDERLDGIGWRAKNHEINIRSSNEIVSDYGPKDFEINANTIKLCGHTSQYTISRLASVCVALSDDAIRQRHETLHGSIHISGCGKIP